ncbi:MAG: hypothetical protein M1415_01515 [Firmicutes bacterium]|nr:hypothetical protein [Bacillota bacterium]
MAAVEEIRRRRLHPIASALLVKYIFSCLIDADRTDARQFEENGHEPWLTDHRDFFERSYRAVVNQVHFYAAQRVPTSPSISCAEKCLSSAVILQRALAGLDSIAQAADDATAMETIRSERSISSNRRMKS